MHKAVILLTKAENKEDAVEKIKEFMEQYNGDVWDWYQIGGRRSGTLAPKYDEYMEKADVLLKQHKSNTHDEFITQASVDDNVPQLRSLWQELGMTGQCPYNDHYHMEEDGNDYDVLPLADCIKKVRDWQQN